MNIDIEVKKALHYILIGCKKYYKEYDENPHMIKGVSKGYSEIEKGAMMLHMLSQHPNVKSIEDNKVFPLDMKRVFELINNCDIAEWVDEYPFLENGAREFCDYDYHFLDAALSLDDTDLAFKENYEYELFVKFNNDDNFKTIKKLCRNDSEYAFSRIGLPTILNGNVIDINDRFIEIFKEHFPNETLSMKLIENIVNLYYKDIPSLNSYLRTEDGYAYCKYCGSFVKKDNNCTGGFTCTFDVCRAKSSKINRLQLIGGYIDRPSKILKYEVLRFVSYPSIIELDLYTKLKKHEDKEYITDLTLYRNKDACDIYFKVGTMEYALDLKEWMHPESLGRRIKEENFSRNNRGAICYIIIPDYLTKSSTNRDNAYMSRLMNTIDGKNLNLNGILTSSGFVKELNRLLRKTHKGDMFDEN